MIQAARHTDKRPLQGDKPHESDLLTNEMKMHGAVNSISMTVFWISLLTFVGEITGVKWLYCWGSTPMAMNTAFCLIVLSIAVFILNNRDVKE